MKFFVSVVSHLCCLFFLCSMFSDSDQLCCNILLLWLSGLELEYDVEEKGPGHAKVFHCRVK